MELSCTKDESRARASWNARGPVGRISVRAGKGDDGWSYGVKMSGRPSSSGDLERRDGGAGDGAAPVAAAAAAAAAATTGSRGRGDSRCPAAGSAAEGARAAGHAGLTARATSSPASGMGCSAPPPAPAWRPTANAPLGVPPLAALPQLLRNGDAKAADTVEAPLWLPLPLRLLLPPLGRPACSGGAGTVVVVAAMPAVGDDTTSMQEGGTWLAC